MAELADAPDLGSSPYPICGIDGIGRHAGFRFLWATVRVQIPHSA